MSLISFGVNTTYDPAYVLFDTTNGPINFPGASSTQRGYAQSIYALLTGRVTHISGTAVLNEKTLKYTYLGPNVQRGHMREFGFYAADSWRARPGLTFNFGLRWELQLPFVPPNDVYTYNTVEDLWGISGYGNLFKPGIMTGREPTYKQLKKGTRVFNIDYRAFAPSFGFAWSPRAGGGWLGRLLGSGAQTVVRGGYSISYNRNGMYDYSNRLAGNPGLTVSATRNVTNGNLVTGSETWPLLFRDKSRPGPGSFAETPTYPLRSTSISDEVNIFDPNLRTPYTQSWSFGIQRELTKSMVLEVRYLGNRHLQEWTARDLNEQNLVENGFLDEFRAAMGNLQANIAAGRGANFRYYGPGTGTSPLPITLAYFSKVPPGQAGITPSTPPPFSPAAPSSARWSKRTPRREPMRPTCGAMRHGAAMPRPPACRRTYSSSIRPCIREVRTSPPTAGSRHTTRWRSSCAGAWPGASRAGELHVRQGPAIEPGILQGALCQGPERHPAPCLQGQLGL